MKTTLNPPTTLTTKTITHSFLTLSSYLSPVSSSLIPCLFVHCLTLFLTSHDIMMSHTITHHYQHSAKCVTRQETDRVGDTQ